MFTLSGGGSRLLYSFSLNQVWRPRPTTVQRNGEEQNEIPERRQSYGSLLRSWHFHDWISSYNTFTNVSSVRIGRRKPLKCKICFESSDNPILHRPWSSALLLLLLPLSIIIMNPAIEHVDVLVIGTLKKNCEEHRIFFVFGRKLKRKKGRTWNIFIWLELWRIFFEEYGIFFVIGRILERRAARRRNQRPELLPCYGWFEASASVQPDFEPIFFAQNNHRQNIIE